MRPLHALRRHQVPALAMVLLLAIPREAGAQIADPPARASRSRPAAPRTTSDDSPAPVEAPAIVARTMPGSFLVVAVPRPVALATASPLRYEVIGTGAGSIIGDRDGTLAGDSLLVTIGVPRTAKAGRSIVAHVRFHADGHADVEIPLELDVGVVQRMVLSVPREQQGAAAGGRLELGWRLRNDGNALDSVSIRIELPTGWRRGDPERLVVLASGMSASGALRVSLPPAVSAGTRRIALVATSGGVERARSWMLIEVADPGLTGRRAGARLTTGIATITDGDGHAATVAALDLAGQLTDSIRVQGRLLSDRAPSVSALRGLSRVGYGGMPWYLVLDAPDWRMDLGALNVGFTPVTGQAATGTGGALALRQGTWSGRVLAGGPSPGLQEASAHYVGTRLTRHFDSVRVSGTITHLVERSEIGRSLDAVGFDVAGPLAFGSSVEGHVAWREHDGGRGIGWLAEITRRSDDGNHLQLRALGAPGGSAAFARAARELSAAATRRLTPRTAVGGAVWEAIDESALGHHVSMRGWSLSPRMLLSGQTALSLEVAGSAYDSRTPVAGFGSGEWRAALVADTRWHTLSATTRLQHGRVERTVDLSSGSAYRTAAGRTAWHAGAGASGRWGSADLTTRLERSDPGAGYEPRRNEAQLRLQSPTIPLRRVDVLLRGEVHHFGWFGDRPSVEVLRAATDVQLPWNVRVTVDVERNPLYSMLGGGAPWSTALRLTRSTTLARFSVDRAAEGTVFQDLDADGTRDAGEPGLAAAVVRHGQSHAATDARGRYAFETRQGRSPELDVRSIPLGWIVTGVVASVDGQRVDIGVAPTSAVRVRLAADTSAQAELVARISWSLVRVTVRNQAGREWASPVDGAGGAFFDAIPAGRYTISLDLSRLPEPMTVVSGDTTFVVGADLEAIDRPLVLRARPIRVRWIEPPPAASEPTVASTSPSQRAVHEPAMPLELRPQ